MVKSGFHNVLAVLLIAFSIGVQAQDQKLIEEIKEFQVEQNEHYNNKKTSPLSRKERRTFEGHQFYPINLDYVVEAKFVKIAEEDTVEMQTSAGNIKYYRPYAKVYFTIGEEECELTVYQSYRLREIEEFKDYLFIPFRDATSGKTSYGGGRYLDILIPDSNVITLNFNLAYNPYCAYTIGYNCTIPPAENTLSVGIEAGLKAPEGH